jgi:hypothetical protein
MIAWFAHASLPLLAAAIFFAMYLAAALVLVVLYVGGERRVPGGERPAGHRPPDGRRVSAQQPAMRQLLRDQIDAYVATEWPQMSAGQATLTVAPAQLVQAQNLALSLPVQTDGQRVAQDHIVMSIDRALEARRSRLLLSNSAIDPLRLTALFLVGATTLAAMGCIQAERLGRAAAALALLATAMAIALTLLVAEAAPFAGQIAVSPEPLIQVRPGP